MINQGEQNYSKPKLVCLTPVYNEAWILERFLQCASLWADIIIIADQGSTDGSIEIAHKYSKVIFIDNTNKGDFNEFSMRNPLFIEARKIEGPKILISLDADEILTPNFDSLEWNTIYNSKPGTVISMPINNLLPDGHFWHFGDIYCGYVDDGQPYESGLVHVPRTIVPPNHDILLCHDISLLHYKFMDPIRMQDRNRWYQCFEIINHVNDSVSIFRRYHHLEAIPINQRLSFPDWWINRYKQYGIEISSILHQHEDRWNRKVIEYFDTYGTKKFRRLNIWTVNWSNIAQSFGDNTSKQYKDPRNIISKVINRYLISTQSKQSKVWVHVIDTLLRKIHY